MHTADVKIRAGNGNDRSDFFPSTHWSVVAAAGESQAEPEIAQDALAELCQTDWAPLYSFVRSRGYAMEDAQDLTQSFSPTSLSIRSTRASIARKVNSDPFCWPH